MRDRLIGIWVRAVASLEGRGLVERALRRLDPPLDPATTHILALGKAAASMVAGAAAVLGPVRGLAVLPAPASLPAGIEAFVGEHPLPGTGSLRAGEALLAAARSLPRDATALVLLSGGGSALAEAPVAGLGLRELVATTQALLAAGAPIRVINQVRRSLSRIKGGGLLRACGAARVEVLALSDVEGDDPAVIASGPFWPAAGGAREALAAAEAAGAELPPSVRALLAAAGRQAAGAAAPARPRPRTTLLAGPADLQRAALREVEALGLHAVPWPGFVHQDVEEVARCYLRWRQRAPGRGAVLVGVGEPTLRLPASPGPGGRAQHLALRMALGLAGSEDVFLAAGSDGRDGPTFHAGACVDGRSAGRATAAGIDLEEALARAESARAAAALGVALPARSTGTNLTDLHLLLCA